MNGLHSSPQRSLPYFTVLLLMVVLFAGASPALASQESSRDDDVASVTSAMTELSRLEEQGNFQDVYDLMAPDARLLLPRQAMVNWFDSGAAPIAVDDPQIAGITFENWTWDTNGESYDDVAHVTYTQQVTLDGEESSQQRERWFIHDGQRWRWFPEITDDGITGLIDELEGSLDYESPFRRAAYLRLDTFWAEMFAGAGLDYSPPEDIIGVESEPYETGCGTERNIDEAAIYYCTVDHTIYFSPQFRELVVDATGTYGWYNIVAHEWGHHIQDLIGIDATRNPELDGGYYVIELELQADCLAGVYAQDATARGTIDANELDAAEAITGASGDFPDTSFDDERAHGTGDQRVQAFLTGYDDGFIGCNLDLETFAA